MSGALELHVLKTTTTKTQAKTTNKQKTSDPWIENDAREFKKLCGVAWRSVPSVQERNEFVRKSLWLPGFLDCIKHKSQMAITVLETLSYTMRINSSFATRLLDLFSWLPHRIQSKRQTTFMEKGTSLEQSCIIAIDYNGLHCLFFSLSDILHFHPHFSRGSFVDVCTT